MPRPFNQQGGTVAQIRPTVLMLLTNAYAPDPRVKAEIDTLIESGYSVRLLAWERDGRQGVAAREARGDLTIERIRVRSLHGRGLSQAWYLLRFWMAAVRRARRTTFHLVHAHDFDTWPAGWLLARWRGVPLVLDAHESFSDMLTGHLPRTACRLVRWLENRLIPRADALVTVGERLAADLTRRGARNMCVLPNCKSLVAYRPDDASRAGLRARLGVRDDQWTLGFIANLGRERPIESMLAAVRDDPRVVWVVGGDGHHAGRMREAASRMDNVRYLGPVPPHEVPGLTAGFDALFCGYDPDNPNARFSAPNKLYEALAAGKPLLSGDYGEVGQIVSEHECGVTVRRFDPPQLRTALDQLASPAKRAYFSERAARLGRDAYNWEKVRGRLPALYAQLGVPAA